MISICFQGKPLNITVIQVCVPTSNAEVEWFYENLQDLLELTPQKDVLLIIGDWNAKIGMLYKYLLIPSGLKCHFKPVIPYWFCYLDDLSIDVSRVLKSPTIIVLISISPFKSVNISLIYGGFLHCMDIYLQLL